MGELAAQAVAEYEEKLENAHLEAVINGGDTPLFAMVDGNLTWRVLSNLLSNACKYSQDEVRARLFRENGAIVLPEGLERTYRHGDRTLTLRSGRNEIR